MTDLLSFFQVSLNHYLALGLILFTLGLAGVFIRKNLIVILMCLELMLNAVNLIFVAFSHYQGIPLGQVYVFFIMTVAAAEAGVGLAIAISIYKRFGTIKMDLLTALKG